MLPAGWHEFRQVTESSDTSLLAPVLLMTGGARPIRLFGGGWMRWIANCSDIGRMNHACSDDCHSGCSASAWFGLRGRRANRKVGARDGAENRGGVRVGEASEGEEGDQDRRDRSSGACVEPGDGVLRAAVRNRAGAPSIGAPLRCR